MHFFRGWGDGQLGIEEEFQIFHKFMILVDFLYIYMLIKSYGTPGHFAYHLTWQYDRILQIAHQLWKKYIRFTVWQSTQEEAELLARQIPKDQHPVAYSHYKQAGTSQFRMPNSSAFGKEKRT